MSETKKEYRIADRPHTIYRVVKNSQNPFVMIDRRPIDNPSLSFKAKGILTYLMSRPDGWEVSVADLVNHATDGDDSIRSGLKELKKLGHIKQTKMREKGRITGWLIEVYELPHADFQHVEKPDMEKPDMENPTQVLSNELGSNQIRKYKAAVISAFDLYGQEIGKTTPTIKAEINKAVETYSIEWTMDAIKEASFSNGRSIKYILAILKRWSNEGRESRKQKKSTPTKTAKSKEDIIDKVLGVEYSEADRQAAQTVKKKMLERELKNKGYDTPTA